MKTFIPLLYFAYVAGAVGGEMQPLNVDTFRLDTLNNTGRVCKLFVNKTSINYFLSRLYTMHPNFIHFNLSIRSTVPVYSNPEVFKPFYWSWTYSSESGQFPYLSWNIDHGILSFGLLDAKTIELKYVLLELQPGETNCSITIGDPASTKNIMTAFHNLTEAIYKNVSNEYEKHYFCYLAINLSIKNSFEYSLATYILFPIQYVNYKCCRTTYDYIRNCSVDKCYDQFMHKWSRLLFGSFILGVVFFLYFPILLFELAGWLARDEKPPNNYYEHVHVADEILASLESASSDEWIYLDGSPPLSVLGLLGTIQTPVMKWYPRALSRFRRLLVLVGMLVVIGIEVFMYKDGIGFGNQIKIPDLVKVGTPVGFLSLLADTKDASKVVAPLFGGPYYVLLAYFVLGLILIVLPTSIKHIVELGLPSHREGSPLFFSTREIMEIALVRERPEFGYMKACALFKCSIYMLFRKVFWARVFEIQIKRFQFVQSVSNSRCIVFLGCIVTYPFLIQLCLVEITACLVYYCFPFFSFVVILSKGISKSFLNMRCKNAQLRRLLHHPVFARFSVVIITIVFTYFGYTACLIFLESLTFIARMITYSLVAVIIFPSVAFGYLFFCLVLLYYLMKLIRGFGDTYLELFATIVEKSVDLEHNVNNITIFDDIMVISNVKTGNLRGIRVNNKMLDVPQNCFEEIATTRCMVKQHNNMNGIPRALFEHIVDKHRPVHIQFLKLMFHLILIIVLVSMTLSTMYKFVQTPTSEFSDVMHVIFIVSVGALPRVLEIALNNGSEEVRREIEGKNIEQSILEYWRDRE